ncbi:MULTISPECIES: YidH family protein [Pseudomonas]|uniref:Membrane protein n=1 Tax=Pseudomonas delhiensis TaxID=366289 RepID=A0A239NFS7_9PSED|nr:MULTISPECIES: DUF202 domain-containing protein [Pseudomonas]PWU31117.1 DUF202 domain-containing protein [Pseudomonas sp. RW407]SDK36053.1 putative membrane protein [Pseudomonas delhiensis]SNT53620.1 putative membrane protein [Pseudomonas delhiensis]
MSDLNDPRVFFAAERTLLAWNRTALALIAFGFVVERTGLLLRLMHAGLETAAAQRMSFWVGLGFIALGCVAACSSALQYRQVVRGLKPVEIPEGYRVNAGPWLNLAVAGLGLLLTLYLAL